MKCPSCGGELRFDISLQRSVCDSCGNTYDPSALNSNDTSAEVNRVADDASGQIDVIEYTCPQCGGVLYSADETVTSYCSFCGSQVLLSSKMVKMAKPQGVIPFIKTKEQCKEAFVNKLKRTRFLPKEYLSSGSSENFRGIYMPYWVYDASAHGDFSVPFTREIRRGSHSYRQVYNCTGHVEADISGISFDASSAFSDNVSETIAPYGIRKMQDYDPAFFSGFYADYADVPSEIYADDARSCAKERVIDKIAEDPALAGLDRPDVADIPTLPVVLPRRAKLAYFPVWFMAWRKKDRVAYAVVNGQTGKVSCDLPVDKSRFFLLTLALLIPVYLFLLLMFPSMTGGDVMKFMQFMEMICSLMLFLNCGTLIKKEEHTGDKGLNRKDPEKEAARKKRKTVIAVTVLLIALFSWLLTFILIYVFAFLINTGILAPLFIFFMTVLTFPRLTRIRHGGGIAVSTIILLITSFIAEVIYVMEPTEAVWYFVISAIMTAGIMFALMSLLTILNRMTTRPLPQFAKR
ncbi:MAG: hypothetical protein K6C99_09270 [Lachnospiraceae bacterium]|nr:hypothetical protein [Lachnospiraceae bacterium]